MIYHGPWDDMTQIFLYMTSEGLVTVPWCRLRDHLLKWQETCLCDTPHLCPHHAVPVAEGDEERSFGPWGRPAHGHNLVQGICSESAPEGESVVASHAQH